MSKELFKKKLITEKKEKDNIEVLRERKYLKRGYVIRDVKYLDEEWFVINGGPYIRTKAAYSLDGYYIGESKLAYRLNKKYGITHFEKKKEDSKLCAIGFSPKEQKWYGWSHRAIFGFGIGSECKKGDCHYKGENKEKCIEDIKNFWDGPYYKDIIAYEGESVESGEIGIVIEWTYKETVPNQELRGTKGRAFSYYPKKFGNGEWVAKTMEDAKQMAIDFSDSVS